MHSLEDFLGFTFTQDMVSARHKDKLAWVQTTKGIRNLFIASAPDYDPIQVTAWREDDGQAISDLQMTDDGSALLFIRGEGKNELGEYPNPLSLNTPPKQKLCYLSLANGHSVPVELAETGLAHFRPDSPYIYYTSKNTLYRIDPSSNDCEAEQILTTRGSISELSWSEQGDCLAMVISRYRHSFIGLHHPNKDSIEWLNPSFDRDINPVWSPDGQQLAFLRCHGTKPDITDFWFSAFSDRFELMVANVESMKMRSYWQCPKGHGISMQEGTRPMTWVNDTQLLFSHEASGFDHIYRLDLDRRKVEALTQGDYLVHSYAADRHSGWLYYTHNNEVPHGYHLARLNLNSGKTEDLQSLLPDESLAFCPAPTASGSALGFILSGSRQPMIPALIKASEGTLHCFGQPTYESGCQCFVPVEGITIPSGDGLEIPCQLFKPEGAGPFPALLTMHGGPWCQTLAGFSNWLGLSYVYACCQYLVSKGFMVLAVNYRASSGYGKAFRQPDDYCWNGASEYQDIVAAGQWLANRDDVDDDRIGLWGKSYGGYLTAMGLARNSDLFKAGVAIEGCHHFPREFRQKHWNSEKFSLTAPEEMDEIRARSQKSLESSPWHYLDQWKSPALLIHPDDDRSVQFEESQRLFHALRERGVEVEGLAIPDEVHTFLTHKPWVTGYKRMTDFFKRHLKP